jgi:hypothetical protein
VTGLFISMTKYHYATVSLRSLVELSQVPHERDSYIAKDRESETVSKLLSSGYKLVFTLSELDAAIFEKTLTNQTPDKVKELLNAQPTEQHGQPTIR